MFGKLMNNFYYGKSGKGDYRKEDLPKNRWQLFWEMLRIRFSALIRLNLMYVVVWLPAMAVLMIAAENLRAAVIFLSVSCLLLTAAGGIGSALARAAVFAAAAAGMAGIFTALRGRENTMKLIKDAV